MLVGYRWTNDDCGTKVSKLLQPPAMEVPQTDDPVGRRLEIIKIISAVAMSVGHEPSEKPSERLRFHAVPNGLLRLEDLEL